jgi:hypothetical protein
MLSDTLHAESCFVLKRSAAVSECLKSIACMTRSSLITGNSTQSFHRPLYFLKMQLTFFTAHTHSRRDHHVNVKCRARPQ